MRLSCKTSKFVWVVLETSMYVSGIGNDTSLGGKVWLWVQRDGGTWSFLTWTKNHVLKWWKRHFCFSKKISLTFSSNWVFPYQSGCLSSWSLPEKLIRPSATGKIKFLFSVGNITSFALSLFWVDFWCVHRFQLLDVCNHYVTLPNSPRVQSVSKEQSR